MSAVGHAAACGHPSGERMFGRCIACGLPEDVHKPFTDDGVTYCGWDGHEGCGEVWPCRAVRNEAPGYHCYPCSRGEHSACTGIAWQPDIACECPHARAIPHGDAS